MEKINWKASFIELIVVFIGISAAFILNNWRESSQNAELEMKYLNTLSGEVLQDSANLKSVLVSNEKKLNKLKHYISKTNSKEMKIDFALVLLGDMLSVTPFYPKSSTYESMKSSGNLNLIGYYELREKVVGYYEAFEEYQLQQQISVDFVYDYVSKFVFEKIDLSNNTTIKNSSEKIENLNNLILASFTFLRQNIINQKSIYEKNLKLQETLKKYIE